MSNPSFNYTHASSFKSHRIFFIIAILFCLYAGYRAHVKSSRLRLSDVQEPIILATRSAPDAVQQIEATLVIVADYFNRGVDVNWDRKTNCIDAAVIFYRYYPYRDQVIIVLNFNPHTRMNHLFNAVLVDNVWKAVEPQPGSNGLYWMDDVWPTDRYDKSRNSNATAGYATVINRERYDFLL